MKNIAHMMFSICPECGCSHNMDVCPDCLRREIEQARQSWPQSQAVTNEQAAPLAAKMVEAWHDHLAGLTPNEMKRIAEDAIKNQPPIEY